MKIQVLGSGCPSCQKLHEVVLRAAQELGLEKQVEYLSGSDGITKIMELGAMTSPVIAIDDQIVMAGFNGDLEKIKALINGQSKKVSKDCCANGQCADDCDCNQELTATKNCQCCENC